MEDISIKCMNDKKKKKKSKLTKIEFFKNYLMKRFKFNNFSVYKKKTNKRKYIKSFINILFNQKHKFNFLYLD